MAKKQFFGVFLLLAVMTAVFALVLFGLNVVTAPLIEANGASRALAPLKSVMPDAKGFEEMTGLAAVPATVQGIYAETSGLGYAVKLSTTEGYTHDPMEITLAVDAEGRISGVEVNTYPDSKDFGADYPATYVGQDSAMADVSLVAGVTYSSSAFKNAVSDGLGVLIANGLISEGVKGDAQILEELMPQLIPGIANPAGIVPLTEESVETEVGTYIAKAMKAANGNLVACIVTDGDATYLAAVNASESCTVFDVEGNDVTASVPAALIDEVMVYAQENTQPVTDKELKKLQKLAGESAVLEPLPLDGVYTSAAAAFTVTDGEDVSFAFVLRPLGYSNMPMEFYFILDADGAIKAMDADELILIAEYYSAYTLDEPSYKAGFAGSTADGFTADTALITGATLSSEAASTAAKDAFAAFADIQNGGEN